MKRTIYISSFTLLIATLFLCQLPVSAQTPNSGKGPATTGSITGEVTDHNGGPLAGATVVITNVQTKESITIKTDVSGEYRAERLAPGEYQVVISASGLVTRIEKTRVKEHRASKVSAHLKAVVPATPPPAKPA
jgi:hypothetical protein